MYERKKKKDEEKSLYKFNFLSSFFNGISTFVGDLMPKLFFFEE